MSQRRLKIRAAGVKADILARTNIGAVHSGYFSNRKNIAAFIRVGVSKVEKNLSKDLRYVDFGGGQGLLTIPVRQYLEKAGHNADVMIADANAGFLRQARAKGIGTKLCNLEDCRLKNVDLVTMRAVLHYNRPPAQKRILRNVFETLTRGGYLIHQVSSGSDANCRLRSRIVNLLPPRDSGYHWTSLAETMRLHRQAGFGSTKIAGYAPGGKWGPEEQWQRARSGRLQRLLKLGTRASRRKIEEEHRKYLTSANTLIRSYLRRYGASDTGINKLSDGSYTIEYVYPIFISRK
ncbi:MAG: class I SAM-dependent methyltransferase [Candidatus Andersenbacteria bacterium]